MNLAIMTIPLAFSLLTLIIVAVKYRKIKRELDQMKANPRKHSDELSDFLLDQRDYGYSFVRVDPSSVMIRSPRGQ